MRVKAQIPITCSMRFDHRRTLSCDNARGGAGHYVKEFERTTTLNPNELRQIIYNLTTSSNRFAPPPGKSRRSFIACSFAAPPSVGGHPLAHEFFEHRQPAHGARVIVDEADARPPYPRSEPAERRTSALAAAVVMAPSDRHWPPNPWWVRGCGAQQQPPRPFIQIES